MKNIYVGNISFNTTDDNLRELFEEYGKVASAKIVFDRYTQRSRGFGFVEMEDDSEAEAAIKALDGQEVDGRNLKVNPARDRN